MQERRLQSLEAAVAGLATATPPATAMTAVDRCRGLLALYRRLETRDPSATAAEKMVVLEPFRLADLSGHPSLTAIAGRCLAELAELSLGEDPR